jgi:hypothetical protein
MDANTAMPAAGAPASSSPPGPGIGPVGQAVRTVLDWLAAAGVTVALDAPRDDARDDQRADPDAGGSRGDAAGPTVRVWPLALLPEQNLRTAAGADGLRLRVRFLLVPDGPAAGMAPVLDALLDAVPDAGLSLALEPIPDVTWAALGARPRAGLFVDAAVRVARPMPVVPRVTGPLIIREAPLWAPHGQVLGPGAAPVADVDGSFVLEED